MALGWLNQAAMSADAEGPRFNFLRAAHDQMRILLCKTWDQPPQTQSLSTNLRQLLKKLTSEILTIVKKTMESAVALANQKFVSSKIGTPECTWYGCYTSPCFIHLLEQERLLANCLHPPPAEGRGGGSIKLLTVAEFPQSRSGLMPTRTQSIRLHVPQRAETFQPGPFACEVK